MRAGAQPARIGPAVVSEQLCAWDGGRGAHYEVWSLTVAPRWRDRAFRLRYALQVPAENRGRTDAATGSDGAHWTREPIEPLAIEPHVEIWAGCFDARNPEQSFGVRNEYPIDSFHLERGKNGRMRLGDASLSLGRATGSIRDREHSVRWDLDFALSEQALNHIDRIRGMLTWPASKFSLPGADARFNGFVEVDGAELAISSAAGCYSHLSARRLADEWFCVHANEFDGHPGTVFHGIGARSTRGGRAIPAFQSILLRHAGEYHQFFRLRMRGGWMRKMGIGYWSFSAMNTRVYLEGTAHCRLRDMLQADCADADGRALYMNFCEMANLKVRIFKRTHGLHWTHVDTIKAARGANVECGSRDPEPAVRRSFERVKRSGNTG